MDSGGQSIFRLYSGVAILGILALTYYERNDMGDAMEFGRMFIPGITIAVSLIGILSVDFYSSFFYIFFNR